MSFSASLVLVALQLGVMPPTLGPDSTLTETLQTLAATETGTCTVTGMLLTLTSRSRAMLLATLLMLTVTRPSPLCWAKAGVTAIATAMANGNTLDMASFLRRERQLAISLLSGDFERS